MSIINPCLIPASPWEWESGTLLNKFSLTVRPSKRSGWRKADVHSLVHYKSNFNQLNFQGSKKIGTPTVYQNRVKSSHTFHKLLHTNSTKINTNSNISLLKTTLFKCTCLIKPHFWPMHFIILHLAMQKQEIPITPSSKTTGKITIHFNNIH